jgi:glycosyltransferase involved in cell wall biosynthesis
VRVLFATKPHLPAIGGAQVTTHELALELVRRGHAVALLAQETVHPEERERPAGELGYPVVTSAAPAAALPGVLQSFGPDVVVVCGYDASREDLTRTLLRGSAGLPSVLYLHDVGTLPLAGDPGLGPDAVVTVSDQLARGVAELGVRAICIPPPVDRDRYRVPTTRRVALLVNPVAKKGIPTALALARRRPDIPFAFALAWHVDPPALVALREEAERLGNVEVRAQVLDPERLYGDARLLLVPSVYPEAWGRVAPEAQASGIPAIAARVGGLPEAVGSGGILVEPGEGLEGWSSALECLWDDQEAYAAAVVAAEAAGRRPELASAAVGERFEAVLAGTVSRAAVAS